MSSLVEVRNLVKHYPLKAGGFSFSHQKVHAVNDISFTLNKGKTLGLVGESGCGKTTTGRCLLRILQPDEGTFFFDQSPKEIEEYEKAKHYYRDLKSSGSVDNKRLKESRKEYKKIESERDFFAYPDKSMLRERLKMQYIFQDPYQSLNPKQQVGKIITEAPLHHGMIDKNQWESQAKHYLDIVGLPADALGKYPHEFSGGQRQRINIARAIALKPDFIVCDEPVSSLDVSIQSQILNLLLDIQKQFGTSYLFIAHNLSVVFYMSDEVAVMYAGRIVEKAPARELYDNPRHPYTRLLMAAAPRINGKKAENPPGLEGEVPSLIELPRGCAFYDRCPIKKQQCLSKIPPVRQIGTDHEAACFYS